MTANTWDIIKTVGTAGHAEQQDRSTAILVGQRTSGPADTIRRSLQLICYLKIIGRWMYLNYNQLRKGVNVDIYSLNTVIVGTGCAGFNSDSLFSRAERYSHSDPEGIKMGTSRNTGSDKQTYYKTLAEGRRRIPYLKWPKLCLMADVCMECALIEAALSARSFFKLVELGVPFP